MIKNTVKCLVCNKIFDTYNDLYLHITNTHLINESEIYRKQKHYLYDNIKFDSSWELATYIWHKDHNIPINREPVSYTYTDNQGILHTYTPDFKIQDKIIEIKGNQYLNDDGSLKDNYKNDIITKHNILIWSFDDVKPYIIYCEKKFTGRYWYRLFKYKQDYHVSKCNHTSLINKEIHCCICGSTFKNGQFLSAHLKFKEHITGQNYYDTYLKKPNEGICIVCGKPTRYINFTRGYTKTCSQQCNNNPLSTKGKNVSKTKRAYTDEIKQQIKEKCKNTCLSKYGVKSNLVTKETLKKSHSKEARNKAKITYLKNKGGDDCNEDS